MRRRRKILIAVSACIVIAVAFVLWTRRLPRVASEALDGADQYELLSLEPERPVPPASPGSDMFHGHRVLGGTAVCDQATRRKLADALRRGAESILAFRPACFNPRHGIRATRAGRTTDFVICFECEQVEVWSGGQLVANWSTDSSPQPTFDQVLQQAGVPLPKPTE